MSNILLARDSASISCAATSPFLVRTGPAAFLALGAIGPRSSVQQHYVKKWKVRNLFEDIDMSTNWFDSFSIDMQELHPLKIKQQAQQAWALNYTALELLHYNYI